MHAGIRLQIGVRAADGDFLVLVEDNCDVWNALAKMMAGPDGWAEMFPGGGWAFTPSPGAQLVIRALPVTLPVTLADLVEDPDVDVDQAAARPSWRSRVRRLVPSPSALAWSVTGGVIWALGLILIFGPPSPMYFALVPLGAAGGAAGSLAAAGIRLARARKRGRKVVAPAGRPCRCRGCDEMSCGLPGCDECEACQD